MRSLIWKEWRENLKWAVLPSLVIGGLVGFLGPPSLMNYGVLLILYLIAAAFGASLGFFQVFFESRGDKRSLLLHRPLGRSHIFLGKAAAGVTLYLVAMGIPFGFTVGWIAVPGHQSEPFHWEKTLPWFADILAGVVYYFAGMLTAQREARWYGSRSLGLGAALGCTILVWSLPEFWQALVAMVVLGGCAGVAAWGSFLSGGAYAPQPRLAKAALALTFLGGLLTISVIGKLLIGQWQWFDSGTFYDYYLDRQGRILVVPWRAVYGPTGTVTELGGNVPPDLANKRMDRNLLQEIEAPSSKMEWPIFRSYRNPGRFYVQYGNDTKPGNEVWYYVPAQGRLVGYDKDSNAFLGSFGPDGFAPTGEQPGERFQGELRYLSRLWEAFPAPYLIFPGGVYTVDFSRRTIRALFTPAAGETVAWARRWKDPREKLMLVLVSTDKAVHVLTEAGAPLLSAPRPYDQEPYWLTLVARLEAPERYFVWYSPAWYVERAESRTMPELVLEYDAAGREIARKAVPPRPLGSTPYTHALFGLGTPIMEAPMLRWANRQLRTEERSANGRETTVLLYLLNECEQYFIPGMSRLRDAPSGLVAGYIGLILLSAVVGALVCFLLARRHAFSVPGRVGWALCGFLFGWAGLLLMLSVQEWPARIVCPKCRKFRVVTRDRCEHCGAPHAMPAADGTEIFEEAAPLRRPDSVLNSSIPTAATQVTPYL